MAQTRALGLNWPLQQGWIGRLVGREIPDEAKAAFENARATFRPKTIKRLQHQRQPIYCPHCGGDLSEAPDPHAHDRPCWSRPEK